jgi:hypothetical protein
MLKYIILLLILPQVFSNNEQILSITEHPLFIKTFGLIDQLLIQVRTMQSLINRIQNMMDQIPYSLHPYFAECFTATHNASSIQYSSKLNEAEMILIPQIKDQLKQATTLEQQLDTMNMTDRIIMDISLNIVRPSLLFVNESLGCLKSKYQLTIA